MSELPMGKCTNKVEYYKTLADNQEQEILILKRHNDVLIELNEMREQKIKDMEKMTECFLNIINEQTIKLNELDND